MKEEKVIKGIGISWKQIGYMTVANVAYALSLNLFLVGNNIAAGGLAGIATVTNYYFGLPVGLMVFIMNTPIGLWAIKVKGWKYVALSVANMACFSLLVDALAFLPCITDDKLVAVVCGGMLYGLASSLAVRAQMSSGGTDLLAKLILTKKKSLTLGKLFMMIDGTVVVMATIAYGNIEYGIYAVLTIGVCSVVTDKLNNGFNKASMFYVFINQNLEAIKNAILYEMHRGGTILKGQGLYTGEDKNILFIVISPAEVPKLEYIVRQYDPEAFMVLCSVSEIIGQGFRRLDLTSSIEEDVKRGSSLEK